MTLPWDLSLIGASSYPDLESAEAVVNVIFCANVEEIAAFCDGPRKRLRPLRAEFDYDVGELVTRQDRVVFPRMATLLVHNDGGYPHIFNSCPEEPRPTAPDLPMLEVLFGAYFHPDWIDDHESPHDVLLGFVKESSGADVRTAVEQLRALAALPTEGDRRAAMLGLGSYFVPRPPGQVDAFLSQAVDFLAASNWR